MRMSIPITCALCIATSSRADTPPAEAPVAEAPVDPAPVAAPEQPAPSSPAVAAAPARPPAVAPAAEHPATPPPARSRIPEIVSTVVTGGLVIATAASYWKWNQVHDRRRAAQWDPSITLEEHARNIEDTETWKKRTWVFIGTTFVSAAVTSFMWMRNQNPSSFSVQPTGDGDGAAVSYSGRF